MRVEQFVMAYQIEQDRIRAMLPEGFQSLRPVLRINAEIREDKKEKTFYIEYNTPVASAGKRGWLNIASWRSPETKICCKREGKTVTFTTSFLRIAFTGVGIEGGCPAEKDNDGIFFVDRKESFQLPEKIDQKKEFCNCEFQWNFASHDAAGISVEGVTLPACFTEPMITYEKQAFTAENAAHIPCIQVLGQYKVIFERQTEDLF